MKRDFPISPEGLKKAIDYIDETLPKDLRGVRVARRLAVIVDEIISNLIHHDESINTADRFFIQIACHENQVDMIIEDTGAPFNPLIKMKTYRNGHDPGGHGLAVIRGLASQISYDRDGQCNRVSLSVDSND